MADQIYITSRTLKENLTAAGRELEMFDQHESISLPIVRDEYHPATSWWMAQCSKLAYKSKAFTARALDKVGFEDVIFFDSVGTQAFLAMHPGRNGEGHFAVLAFRGTEQNFIDALSDVALFKTQLPDDYGDFADDSLQPRAHTGFVKALRAVWGTKVAPIEGLNNLKSTRWYGPKGVSEAIAELGNDEKYARYPVFFTGHSLGGALACLAYIKSRGFLQAPYRPSALYTYGCPRVINHSLSQAIVKMSQKTQDIFLHRVVNYQDIVPRIPLSLGLKEGTRYEHVGMLTYLNTEGDRQTGIQENEGQNSLIVALTLAQIGWTLFLEALTLTFFDSKLSLTTIIDHSIDHYIGKLYLNLGISIATLAPQDSEELS